MGKSAKTLCEWKREKIEEDMDELKALVRDARFICRKCGRVSNDEKALCKPEKL